MIIDDIGYIFRRTQVHKWELTLTVKFAHPHNDLIKIILVKCQKDDMSIGYYNVSIDDNNLLNIYVFRMFFMMILVKSNRRSRN
jgi:hypothetical protein